MDGDPYAKIAPYYDLMHAELKEDIDFVLALAAQARGPVLELGCGTGRLLLPLAHAGHRVTGLDSSEAMLARARERLATAAAAVRERVQLVAADMTGFALPRDDYALALLSYNTLLHLDAAAAVAACRAVARHLAPQGTLFIDVVNPLLVEQTPNDRFLTLERTFADPRTGDDVVVLASNWLDEATQTLRITWLYDVSPAGGGAVRRTVAPMTYHYYHPHQLELLLQRNGFRLEGIYGDYDQAPFGEASERLLLIAQKK